MKLPCRTKSSLKAESQACNANGRRKNDRCPSQQLRSCADITNGEESSCDKIEGK